jgi:hypothetical protein
MVDQKEMCFTGEDDGERIRIKLSDVKGVRTFGVLEPYGIFVDVRGSSDYQFYINVDRTEMTNLLESLKSKIESLIPQVKVDLSRLYEPW